ncbi:histidinol-phosphate transaminase [Kineosporia sp. NBRC 101731]|uniref:histidinol-phosphate transaminase n=1 Tax=Kineosporia sp. NBRC 101731 TaxID=3032199 RepID=UPI0024A4E19A|nr:histidinol-phosphate transaminase [Kineosporia sp. NBRC 101731]GLY33727.1 histidinol-phosphate aminotransferase [Kineosporia sp. NBRC 101731]
MSNESRAEVLARLPLRDDLRGRTPYGAPQLEVPVRLNTNENSYDVPGEVVAAILEGVRQQARHLNRYPDREFTGLREDLANYLGHELEADQIWAANGSNEVLQQLLQAFAGPGRTVLGFTPSYSMHPIITTGTGATWVDGKRGRADQVVDQVVDQGTDDPHQFDLHVEETVEQIRRHHPAVTFLCSPNNPTGTALDLEVVKAAYEATDGIVIVDEAYHEFARVGTPSALSLLEGRERLVVSRTMSKAFALAGVRLGYLAAHPAVNDAIRLVRLPYHLSSLTQAAARAALWHSDVLLDTVEVIKSERDRIVTSVQELGLSPAPSDANFVLIGGLNDEKAIWRSLLSRGVLIRDVGLPGFLRVTAGTPAENTTFLDALADSLLDAPVPA